MYIQKGAGMLSDQAGLREQAEHYRQIKTTLWGKIPQKTTQPSPKVEPEPTPALCIGPPVAPRDWLHIASLPPDSMNRIMKEVAWKHRISVAEIKSHVKNVLVVRARQEFCYRAYAEAKTRSMPDIARFCHRDHTSVLHAIRAYAHQHDRPLPRGMTWGKRFGK